MYVELHEQPFKHITTDHETWNAMKLALDRREREQPMLRPDWLPESIPPSLTGIPVYIGPCPCPKD